MNIAGVGARIADNDNLVPENPVLHLVQPMDLLEKVPSRVALKGVWGYEEKAYPIAVEIVPVSESSISLAFSNLKWWGCWNGCLATWSSTSSNSLDFPWARMAARKDICHRTLFFPSFLTIS